MRGISPAFLLVKYSPYCYNAYRRSCVSYRIVLSSIEAGTGSARLPLAGIKRETGERPVQPPLL